MKNLKKMFRFILVMSMIFVFALPAMAVEPNVVSASEDASDSQIEPRYPGRCAIKQVKVYAADKTAIWMQSALVIPSTTNSAT